MSIIGLPIASAATLGAIKVGVGLSIAGDGTLDATGSAAPATTTTLGTVIVPTAGHLTVDGSGNIGVPVAAAGTLGVVRVGAGLSIDGSGILSATGASAPATTTTLGTVIVPTAGNLTVDGSGNIGVPVAAAGTLGVIRIGSGLSIDGSGIVSVPAAVPATTTTLGTVIVPTAGNLTVDGSGNIGVPVAAAGTLGVVRVGSGLSIDGSGILSASSSGGFTWSSINSNTNASTGNGYSVDTSGGVVVLTLPSSPSPGYVVGFLDAAGTFNTNKLTLGRNGQPIMGLAEDMDVTTQYAASTLVFDDGTNGWRLAV